MIDETEAEPFRNSLLQSFQIGIDKFDHAAAFDINQVIVMGVFVFVFVERASIVKLELFAVRNSKSPVHAGRIRRCGSGKLISEAQLRTRPACAGIQWFFVFIMRRDCGL